MCFILLLLFNFIYFLFYFSSLYLLYDFRKYMKYNAKTVLYCCAVEHFVSFVQIVFFSENLFIVLLIILTGTQCAGCSLHAVLLCRLHLIMHWIIGPMCYIGLSRIGLRGYCANGLSDQLNSTQVY